MGNQWADPSWGDPDREATTRTDDVVEVWAGSDVGTRTCSGTGCPGGFAGAGSALSRPGRRIDAGDTLWDPLNPPHPDTSAEAARSHDVARARDRCAFFTSGRIG